MERRRWLVRGWRCERELVDEAAMPTDGGPVQLNHYERNTMLLRTNPLRKVLSQRDLDDIAHAIRRAESRTAGEIRVSIHMHRHRRERGLSLQELALHEFHRLGMEKTRDRTGVLLYLLFAERQFHIAADEGIHKRVEDGTWDRIAEEMSRNFHGGRFRDGIIHGVRSVGEVLSAHVPRRPDDTNELPDKVNVD